VRPSPGAAVSDGPSELEWSKILLQADVAAPRGRAHSGGNDKIRPVSSSTVLYWSIHFYRLEFPHGP